MASINKRPNGKWRARYRDTGGKQHARHFDRRVDAERWLDGIRGDLARGTYVDPAAGRRTFEDYAEAWQEAQVHRASTRVLVESHLRNHVLPFFGNRALSSVRPSEIQAWVKGRTEVLSPATVEVVYRYVVAIFRAAVEDRLIPVSPCRGVKLPKVERRRVEPLATEQVRALAEAIPARYTALVWTAAGTGLRQGELFGLTLTHVDFLRRSLRVEQQLVLLAGGPPYLAPPKTDASRRTVPLPAVVVEALARHLEQYPVGPEGLVFTNDQGEAIRRNHWTDVWRPAAEAAEMPVGTTMHDLRHYYASLLIRHGESVKVVQSRLGHASAAETLDTYSHMWPDNEDRTRAAIDAVLGTLEDPVRTAADL